MTNPIQLFSILWKLYSFASYFFAESAPTRKVRSTPGPEGYVAVQPKSLNVSTGDIAEFSCKLYNFTPNFVNWNLNGTRIQNYYADVYTEVRLYNLSSNPVVSILRIWVTTSSLKVLEYGHLNCEGLDLSESKYTTLESTTTSVLRVQGPLSAPMNLTALLVFNNLFLQWIPPFTLHGVDILGYLIETGSVSSELQTDELQNSSNMTNDTNCVEYKICVSAETAAGVGEETCVLRSRIAGVLGSLDDRRVEVMVLHHDNKSLLQDHYTNSCSEDQEPHNLIITNLVEQAELNLTSNSSIQPLHHNDSFIKFNLSIPLATNDNVVFTNISLHNISNHVEDVLITSSDSGSVVECVFAQYSSTTSCLLTITCENHTENITTDCEIHLAKGSSSLLPLCKFNCSLFTVSAFDVIDNVTSDNRSVSKNNVSLTFTSVQPTSAHFTSMTTVTSFASTLTPTDSLQTSIDLVFTFTVVFFAIDAALVFVCCCCGVFLSRWFCLHTRRKYSPDKYQRQYPGQKRMGEVGRSDLHAQSRLVGLSIDFPESPPPGRYYPKPKQPWIFIHEESPV